MYELNLDKNTSRILSATFAAPGSVGPTYVNYLPEGDISNYLYLNGEYIYNPIPDSHVPDQPTFEERLADIENALCEIVEVLG